MEQLISTRYEYDKLLYVKKAITSDPTSAVSILNNFLIDKYQIDAVKIMLPYIKSDEQCMEILTLPILNTTLLDILFPYIIPTAKKVSMIMHKYRYLKRFEAVKILLFHLLPTSNTLSDEMTSALLGLNITLYHTKLQTSVLELLLTYMNNKNFIVKLSAYNYDNQLKAIDLICKKIGYISRNDYQYMANYFQEKDVCATLEIILPYMDILGIGDEVIELLMYSSNMRIYGGIYSKSSRKIKNYLTIYIHNKGKLLLKPDFNHLDNLSKITYLYSNRCLDISHYPLLKQNCGNHFVESLFRKAFKDNNEQFIEYIVGERSGSAVLAKLALENKETHVKFLILIKYRKRWKHFLRNLPNYEKIFISLFDPKMIVNIKNINICDDVINSILTYYILLYISSYI